MKTFFRRAFYAAAVLSALMLISTVILWPLSYFRAIDFYYAGEARYTVGIDCGRAYLSHNCVAYEDNQTFHLSILTLTPRQRQSWSYLIWNYHPSDNEGTTWVGVCLYWHIFSAPALWTAMFMVPCSYLIPTFAILPILALRKFRRDKALARIRLGLCPNCAYDLRAHTPGSKCPECGAHVSSNLDSKPGTNSPLK